MKDFKGIYRTESNRLKGYNYSQEGLYFITIVVSNREKIFGSILNGKMTYSEFGLIAKEQWIKSFEIRKELFCDEYTIMPNHIHAIVGIQSVVETHGRASLLQAEGRASQQEEDSKTLYRKPKSISSFIEGYKSRVTAKIDDYIDTNDLTNEKYNRNNRLWQPNYYDRVIRDKKEYWKMKTYIKNNLKNWVADEFH